eukprot:m.70377 g.70377  ORF g.70377 m.70377 type:complete len:160 (-) comp12258_c0_seq5:1867-2346(-)
MGMLPSSFVCPPPPSFLLLPERCAIRYICQGSACPFRHSETAKNTTVICNDWKNSVCFNAACPFRHFAAKPCYWETQPTGCQKPDCPFTHSKPRTAPHAAPIQQTFSNVSVPSIPFSFPLPNPLSNIEPLSRNSAGPAPLSTRLSISHAHKTHLSNGRV